MSKLRFSIFPLTVVIFVLPNIEVWAGDKPTPCNSTITAQPGVICACPEGDGTSLASAGLTITLIARDAANLPCRIPATDMWLIGCSDDLLALCGGPVATAASQATDADGRTTFTGALAVGGCDPGGVQVVAMGLILGGGCGVPCIPIKVKSVDIDRNLVVDLVDFASFGAGYTSPPKTYNECIDYTAPFGSVTLPDFAKFGTHAGHTC